MECTYTFNRSSDQVKVTRRADAITANNVIVETKNSKRMSGKRAVKQMEDMIDYAQQKNMTILLRVRQKPNGERETKISKKILDLPGFSDLVTIRHIPNTF